MRQFAGRVRVVLVFLAAVAALPLFAASNEERIEKLEREVAELRELLDDAKKGGADADRLDEIDRRIEILANELESLRIGKAAVQADESMYGFGPAASKIYRTERGVSIGGYGEMVYADFATRRDDGTPSGATDELDFLRAVLYVGYKFNDRFLFNSEIEFEHASTDEDGSVSVEFAYIDYMWKTGINVRAGMVLMPMGFINEIHEPTVYLGSVRPETELRIIPTTWRENGAGLFGDLGPFTYRSYVVNGLDAAGFDERGLRGGRQKGSKTKAEDFAWTGRIDYVGTNGLVVGASGFLGNSGQDLTDTSGDSIDVGTSILEGHVEWRWRGLELRLLGARAELDDVARLNDALQLSGSESIGEELVGGYVQVGYDVFTWLDVKSKLIPFVRWEHLNTQDSVPAGFQANPANDLTIETFGLSYKPITQLVIKLDYQNFDNEANTGVDRFNVALGYVF